MSSSKRRSSKQGAALVVAAVVTIACGAPAGPVVHEHQRIDRGAANRAHVEIGMTGGELEVKSGAGSLLEGDFEFNIPALKPTLAYTVNDGAGGLKVSQGSASGSYTNHWRLSLDETTPLDLELNLGAGDAQLVLGHLNLRSLAIRLGAGDLRVDLRGMPTKSYSVSVQAGAGDTTIELPATVAISASTSGLIGDVNVDGLEKRDGHWINPRVETSPVTIEVQVRHAIGDLKLRAE